MWYARIVIWLTYVSSQDVLYLFLLESPFDHQLVVSIYGTAAKNITYINTEDQQQQKKK